MFKAFVKIGRKWATQIAPNMFSLKLEKGETAVAPFGVTVCVCKLLFTCSHHYKQGAEGSPVVASANEAPHWMIRKTYLQAVPGCKCIAGVPLIIIHSFVS